MIRQGTDSVTIVVETEEEVSGRRSILGIRREKREMICRLDGQDVKKRSILAEALPVQWIGSQPQLFLGLGPDVRRRFLDMGLFHVEHSYLGVLSEFQRNLRQRNSAIRQGSAENIRIWDKPLAKSAEILHRHRDRFVEELLTRMLQIRDDWDPDFALDYRYKPGWDQEKSLDQVLAEKTEVDLRIGYTSRGPHRAELEFFSDGGSAEKMLSRGQQKLLVIALNLALIDLISDHKRHSPVLLIDDLAAELDPRNRQRIISELEGRGGQVFLTKIEDGSLRVKGTEAKTFHVEHGELGC